MLLLLGLLLGCLGMQDSLIREYQQDRWEEFVRLTETIQHLTVRPSCEATLNTLNGRPLTAR